MFTTFPFLSTIFTVCYFIKTKKKNEKEKEGIKVQLKIYELTFSAIFPEFTVLCGSYWGSERKTPNEREHERNSSIHRSWKGIRHLIARFGSWPDRPFRDSPGRKLKFHVRICTSFLPGSQFGMVIRGSVSNSLDHLSILDFVDATTLWTIRFLQGRIKKHVLFFFQRKFIPPYLRYWQNHTVR